MIDFDDLRVGSRVRLLKDWSNGCQNFTMKLNEESGEMDYIDGYLKGTEFIVKGGNGRYVSLELVGSSILGIEDEAIQTSDLLTKFELVKQ